MPRRRPTAGSVVGVLIGLPLVLLSLLGAVRLFGYSSQIILTGSMEPMASPGSVVVMRPVPAAAVREGMVVLIPRPSADGRPAAPVMHRVTSLRDVDGVVTAATKGDANPAEDPDPFVIPDHTFTPVVVVPHLGFFFAAMRTPAGWAVTAILPWSVYAITKLRRIWRSTDAMPALDGPLAA